MTKSEKRILLLASVFLAIALNVHRLFVMLPGEARRIGLPWVFNAPELAYQTLFQFGYCIFIGFLNLKWLRWENTNKKEITKNLLFNLLFLVLFLAIGSISQKYLFQNAPNLKLFILGYMFRLITSLVLLSIMLKIVLLNRVQKRKELENEQLKSAYFDAEIKNLKAQINPHFLFNALSSLSALVRENPNKAQDYITHLSKVFRYSLGNHHEQLIGLDKELELLDSNIQLLKMRFEDALDIHIHVPKTHGINLPHMSLQPLLENAVKHNYVSKEYPLRIDVFQENDKLIFKNTLKEAIYKEPSTGIGLLNLNERYQILMGKSIDIVKSDTHFTVQLPLNP
ncbi:sensor histidine kinase [Flagellimonas zhangzhouensis]|uniref:Histidine kinase n=1 Tax=Flagellimonas zhangzhouensis TaxID=1073328 RepID=A0A1H2WXQ9_9FLAO|nr:histidine kinase [Allomuricauda zhangzhouensis]SDQ25856.1 Histidine kinase [Allomuricauda zhangzhouensis]SDW85351.1 Histidine kinase [Allomuricauda zhangzhouensis]